MHTLSEAEHRYMEARVRTAKGRLNRVLFSGGACALALLAIDWRIVAVQFAAMAGWEALIALAIYPALDRLATDRSYNIAIGWMAVVALIGSFIYAAYAAILLSAHSILSVYLATAWLMGSLLHVHVYYSSSRVFLFPQLFVPAGLMVAQPFFFIARWSEAAAASTVLFLFVLALLQFSRDRNELLERVAQWARDKRAAEAESAAKSQFLAVMSHELRTPLNAIIGYSEIMREDAEADGRASDVGDHDRVLGAARRLLRIISDILDLTKIEGGKAELEIGDHDVASVANDVVSIVRPLAAENGNDMRIVMAPSIGRANTDAFKLSQCLLNLLSNAAKFTRNGRITLSVAACGDRLTFAVSDTGIGVPADRMDDLFQPFVQADASITRNYGGTGLGLAITRRIARLLGGDVTVESVEGAGSTFTLAVARDLSSVASEKALPMRVSARGVTLAAAR